MVDTTNFPKVTLLPKPEGFDLLPDGDYQVQVCESSFGPTGSGDALKLTLRVLNGPYRNRRVWLAMCFYHSAEVIRDRAMNEYIALLAAVGLRGEEVADTIQLHDHPFIAQVYTSPAKAGYKARNSAHKFRRMPEVTPPVEAQAALTAWIASTQRSTSTTPS